MAQGLYPDVVTPGSPSKKDPEDVGCDYMPDGFGTHVEQVNFEVMTQEFGRRAKGSDFKLPRALAQSIVSNPTAAGLTDAHFIELDGPGEQAVFTYGNHSEGGSLQTLVWSHGNLVASLVAVSFGTTGYTASLQSVLLADARTIDAGLG